MVWPALIAAGAAVAGGLMSSASARSNRLSQEEFAKHGISWRVADAKRAGIHPLYALGGQIPTFSPVHDSTGDVISQGGQDISRAMMANMDRRERSATLSIATVQAAREEARAQERHVVDIEGTRLQNALLSSQIGRLNSAQVGPPGAGVGSVERVPSRVVVGSRGEPARQPGELTEYQYSRLSDGGYLAVPSEQMKERLEDSPMEWEWYIRNNVLPRFGGRAPPPPYRAPVGMRWRLSFLTGAWYLESGSRSRRRVVPATRSPFPGPG